MSFAKPTLRLLACGLLICASVAQAKRSEAIRIELAPDATAAQLHQQRQALETAISDTDEYAELRATERTQVTEALELIAGHLDAAGTLASLPEADRTAVLGEQAKVNEILATAHDDSRKVCKREQEIGSNRLRSVCLTVAQRRRQSEGARRLRDFQPEDNRRLGD